MELPSPQLEVGGHGRAPVDHQDDGDDGGEVPVCLPFIETSLLDAQAESFFNNVDSQRQEEEKPGNVGRQLEILVLLLILALHLVAKVKPVFRLIHPRSTKVAKHSPAVQGENN